MLDRFDAAVALGNEGRTRHRGGTAELKTVATEITRIVRLMDGRNRQRFRDDTQLLTSWIGASTVLGKPRSVTSLKDSMSSAEDTLTSAA